MVRLICIVKAFLILCSLAVSVKANGENVFQMKDVIKQINQQGPRIGVITTNPTEEIAFFSSGILIPDSTNPFIDINGRRFRIGTIHDRKVIYVRCGIGILNAGVTTQTMAMMLNVNGIVHFGIAGNTNNSLFIGDVVVPKYVAHTSHWDWLQSPSSKESSRSVAHLDVGDYNVPQGNRDNLLGKISFRTDEFYSTSGTPNKPQYLLWFNTTTEWLLLAEKLQGIELASCVNGTICLPRAAKMVTGLRASTADIFVDNGAYRNFLFKEFEVSSVDEESAAVVMTSLSNNLKVIVFRGLSDLAGSKESDKNSDVFGSLAATNMVKAMENFIKSLPIENSVFSL